MDRVPYLPGDQFVIPLTRLEYGERRGTVVSVMNNPIDSAGSIVTLIDDKGLLFDVHELQLLEFRPFMHEVTLDDFVLDFLDG